MGEPDHKKEILEGTKAICQLLERLSKTELCYDRKVFFMEDDVNYIVVGPIFQVDQFAKMLLAFIERRSHEEEQEV